MAQVMTPEEFKKEMEQLKREYVGDPEARHGIMETFMCQVLRQLGYKEGVAVFYSATKWNA